MKCDFLPIIRIFLLTPCDHQVCSPVALAGMEWSRILIQKDKILQNKCPWHYYHYYHYFVFGYLNIISIIYHCQYFVAIIITIRSNSLSRVSILIVKTRYAIILLFSIYVGMLKEVV